MRISNRMKSYIDNLLFGGKMSIRKRLTKLILLHSIIIITIFAVIFFYGIELTTNAAKDMGISLGNESYINNASILIKDDEHDLQYFTNAQALELENRLRNLEHDTIKIKDCIEKIEKYPELYHPISMDYIENSHIYDRSPIYFQYTPEFSPEDNMYEIGMTANISDVLIRIVDGSLLITNGFVASNKGYFFSVENRTVSPYTIPRYTNLLNTEGYRHVINNKGTSFSNVAELSERDTWGFYCAMPYHNASGEVAGIVGTLANWKSFEFLMDEYNKYYSRDGFAFVLDENGRIIISTESTSKNDIAELNSHLDKYIIKSSNKELTEIAATMIEGKNGLAEIALDNKIYYIAYAPISINGWSLGVGINKNSIIEPAKQNNIKLLNITKEKLSLLESHVHWGMAVFFVFFILLTYIFMKSGKRMAEHFVTPISELSDGVRAIAAGDIDKKLNIHTGDEIEHLATCFNAMTDELKIYMANVAQAATEKAHISAELDVAAHIQESTLPSVFPAFPEHKEFDIYALMKPAREVGGDFYDFYLVDENHLIFTIADVSGKGIAASLFMVISKTVMKNLALSLTGKDDLSPLISCTNEQLCKENGVEMFVTAFVGMLELSTGNLSYVNAGHNPPLIYRSNEKRFHYMQVERNFILGGMEGIDYISQQTTLAPGDKLLLYTDGLTEALNESTVMYGEKRLLDFLNNNDTDCITPMKLINDVRKSLREYVGTAEQSDDLTMLSISYNGLGTNTMKEELTITSNIDNLHAVNQFIDDSLASMDISKKIRNRLKVVIEEIFVNISNYAYDEDEGPVTIRKAICTEPSKIIISFIDNGKPYNPLEKEDPDINRDADKRKLGGLGIFLTKNFTDDINYEFIDGKNVLTLTKNLSCHPKAK